MANYKLLKDYESPSGRIYSGVVKSDMEWLDIFHDLCGQDLDIKTDWFKKEEEERLVLELWDTTDVHTLDEAIMFLNNSIGFGNQKGDTPTEEQLELCEKAINEEMVEKELILQWIKKYAEMETDSLSFGKCIPTLHSLLTNEKGELLWPEDIDENLYTKDQVIKMFNEWISTTDATSIEASDILLAQVSFKEHINRK